MKPVT